MENKKCIMCGLDKSISEFYPNKYSADRFDYNCKSCVKIKARQWAIENPDKIKKTNKEMYEKNREERILKQREWSLNNKEKISKAKAIYRIRHPELSREWTLKKHGLTMDDFNNMILNQKNRCGICYKSFAKRSEVKIDHNHTTGMVRGLLCNHCNTALGFTLDDIEILKSMILYLEKYGSNN